MIETLATTSAKRALHLGCLISQLWRSTWWKKSKSTRSCLISAIWHSPTRLSHVLQRSWRRKTRTFASWTKLTSKKYWNKQSTVAQPKTWRCSTKFHSSRTGPKPRKRSSCQVWTLSTATAAKSSYKKASWTIWSLLCAQAPSKRLPTCKRRARAACRTSTRSSSSSTSKCHQRVTSVTWGLSSTRKFGIWRRTTSSPGRERSRLNKWTSCCSVQAKYSAKNDTSRSTGSDFRTCGTVCNPKFKQSLNCSKKRMKLNSRKQQY